LQTAEKEITADLQYWTERRLLEAEGLAATQAKEQGGLLVHLLTTSKSVAATGAGEVAKTSATLTGVAARTTAEVAGNKATLLDSLVTSEKAIFNAAAVAAAKTFQAFAGNIVTLPFAPVAAAASFVAVEAFGNLASLDVGTNYVPSDMVANIHEGERIIPKADNRALMAAVGGGGAGALHVNFGDFNVHGGPAGMSPSDFKRALSDHASHVADALHSATRGGWTSKAASPFKGA